MKSELQMMRSPHRKKFPGRLLLFTGMVIAGLTTGVVPLPAAAIGTTSLYKNDVKVSGKVTDEKGEPLIGVSVFIKGTTSGVTTDIEGKYKLNVTDGNAVLVFKYIGYIVREVAVGNQTVISVSLTPESKNLSEVIVVGYGTQKKATLTGSISVVKGADLVKSPQANLSNSFAGRITGVTVNNTSGEPGYDGSNILVRGLATTGSNSVLVVVDGIPGQIGGLERLDPNDIESISVLKDASAAVYGSRAANGAILITTKRGKISKPTVSYSFNQGFNSPTRLAKLADASTYATIVNEIQYYNNNAGGMNQQYSAAQIQKFKDGSDPLNYPNTDWEKAALKDYSLQNQQNLNVIGGTEDVKYFASLGTIYQDGLYKNGATNYHQYNFRANVDAQITKRFKIGVSLSGREEDRQYPATGAGNIFRSIYRAYPTQAAIYPNGLPSTGIENNNPVVMPTDAGGISKNPTQVFNGIVKGSYSIPGIDGLSLDGFYSADKSGSFTKNFSTPYTLYNYNSINNSYNPVVTGGSAGAATLYEAQLNQSLITSNIKLNFVHRYGKHDINAFVAYEQSQNTNENFNATRLNFPTVQTPELSQGGTAPTDAQNSGSSYDFTRKSYIGRVAYNYNEKYLAEVQMRADGSSTFPEGNRYGYFPSVSAGWRISEESWFNKKYINDLKIRASYGSLGNDNVDQFQFYDNYSFYNNYVIGGVIHPGINLTKLANPAIHWEVAKKTDIGLNAVLFNNFSLEFIYFKQQRSDILLSRNASLPGTSGIVNPYGGSTLTPSENIGKIDNNGFESTLGYTTHTGQLNWGVSGNLTYAKSKVVFIDEAAGTLDYQRITGGPLNNSLLYNAIGIFRTPADLANYPHVQGAQLGDLIYEDYNHDGKITADDQVRTKYGNIPEITYGINLNASYKNFDLSIVFAGQAHVSQYVLPESGTIGNFYSSWADNRWSPTNGNGSYPRVSDRTSNAISGGLYNSTFWLNDASFFRLKNIELGYSLPKSLLSKLNISGIRLYANGFNLFTLTKVKDYDPEGTSGSGQFYPQQRIINIGANVKF